MPRPSQGLAPSARLNQFFRISRLLAGQVDFRSAIRAVGAEVAVIVPHDHLDVCIIGTDGRLHTAYKSGIDTAWGRMQPAPIGESPIAPLLAGRVDHMLTPDACADPRFDPAMPAHRPIWDHALRSRLHLPMQVHGEIIGALSCSRHAPDAYGAADVKNARYVAELLSPYFFALRAGGQARQSAIVEAEARAREEGLRQGALQLTEALEEERQRIGMDLHDQTLADLTRIARGLDRLAGHEGADAAAIAALGQSLQSAMAALRQIIEAAKPSVLHLFGFAHAVENHVDRAIRDSGQRLQASLTDRTEGAFDRLDPAVAVALFRIVQEAVNNAVHHADADALRIDLGLARGQLTIAVEDDGRGWRGAATRPGSSAGGRTGAATGSGIANMRTRARLISARFAIGPGPGGRGTRVALALAAPDLRERAVR